jgi:hypothetical protein
VIVRAQPPRAASRAAPPSVPCLTTQRAARVSRAEQLAKSVAALGRANADKWGCVVYMIDELTVAIGMRCKTKRAVTKAVHYTKALGAKGESCVMDPSFSSGIVDTICETYAHLMATAEYTRVGNILSVFEGTVNLYEIMETVAGDTPDVASKWDYMTSSRKYTIVALEQQNQIFAAFAKHGAVMRPKTVDVDAEDDAAAVLLSPPASDDQE